MHTYIQSGEFRQNLKRPVQDNLYMCESAIKPHNIDELEQFAQQLNLQIIDIATSLDKLSISQNTIDDMFKFKYQEYRSLSRYCINSLNLVCERCERCIDSIVRSLSDLEDQSYQTAMIYAKLVDYQRAIDQMQQIIESVENTQDRILRNDTIAILKDCDRDYLQKTLENLDRRIGAVDVA